MTGLPVATIVRDDVQIVLEILRADALSLAVVASVCDSCAVPVGYVVVELSVRLQDTHEALDGCVAVTGVDVESLALGTQVPTTLCRGCGGACYVPVVAGVSFAIGADVVGVETVR